MPTDYVKNRTFKETLSGTVRFRIPFFQRGYAWEKKQWDQLFLDLQEQIIRQAFGMVIVVMPAPPEEAANLAPPLVLVRVTTLPPARR